MSLDITKELCLGCGEYKQQGLIPTVMHSCHLNTYNYIVGSFGMRQLRQLFTMKDELQSFKDLLVFPHFKSFQRFDKFVCHHPVDEICYSYAREFEIKQMKIIRTHIEHEEILNSKY